MTTAWMSAACSVFGRVVGGLDTLTAMERVPTDKDDRPLSEIKITGEGCQSRILRQPDHGQHAMSRGQALTHLQERL